MKQKDSEIKALVKEKYGQIANQSRDQNLSSCCGAASSCGNDAYVIMADDYSTLEGYNSDADLGLGCGLPTEFAKIREGDTVIDLGSGAGNDCFVARKFVGANGKVIGIDFTDAMISKARQHAEKVGFNNVEFRQGDIEEIPATANTADVVISNCVLNLVPDKAKVFSEIFRVLKQKKHFSISDIVLEGELPDNLKEVAELYAGCISGAIQREEYLSIIKQTGFTNIDIQKEKKISIPDDILIQYISQDEIEQWRSSGVGIYSITVYAEKPCCEPGSGCC
ncbi:MAG: arsenite methyltransferase [Chitinophagaceae bacterium]|nr:arsenite methyltransferase [Chitinophagaceae bacterium]